jgi:hypothetical protein
MHIAGGKRKCGFAIRLAFAAIGATTVSVGAVQAQSRPEKSSGTVIAVGPDGIRMSGPLKTVIMVVISKDRLTQLDKAKILGVTVNGEAESSYLGKDQCASFTAELSGGITGTGEVDDVTIFNADDSHPLEMMDTKPEMDDSETGAKRPAANRTSTYMVSGQVQSFRDGQLIVKAPNERGKMLQIKVRLSDNAVVKVHSSDFTLARPGDMIDVEGLTQDPAGQVGTIVAEKVTITGTKPFVNAKRAKAIAAAKLAAQKQERKPRPAKNAVVEEEAEADEPAAMASADSAAPGEAAPAKAPAKAVSLRQAGDPPAEGLILVDGFTVDGNSAGGGGLTALHLAARYGQTAVVELLLEAKAQPEVTSKSGVTPLMVAAWQGHLAVVKALLEKGVSVAAADSEGQTAIMYAAASGNADVVQMLLDHNAQANHKSKIGTNALSIALEKKEPTVVTKLRQAIKESAPTLDF